MSSPTLTDVLRIFRRQVLAVRTARIALLAVFIIGLLWSSALAEPAGERAMFLFAMGALVFWLWMAFTAVRLVQEVQTSNVLIATGQFDRAEAWLRSIISRFSLSLQAKLMACQQLAVLSLQRGAHEDVVAVCRELLRQPLRGVQHLVVGTRLMLADSLLILERVAEAYDAMRPVYDLPLTLADRMKLLPIQLRYELAADHSESAVQGLAEKVRIAELLDADRAALVHALLAEACRRREMSPQRDFLLRRARLYADLAPLAERYGVISPVLALP